MLYRLSNLNQQIPSYNSYYRCSIAHALLILLVCLTAESSMLSAYSLFLLRFLLYFLSPALLDLARSRSCIRFFSSCTSVPYRAGVLFLLLEIDIECFPFRLLHTVCTLLFSSGLVLFTNLFIYLFIYLFVDSPKAGV